MPKDIDTNQNKYKETRSRISRFKNKFISDKEIIEELAKEIEYYRNKIIQQKEEIDKLNIKSIERGEETLDIAEDDMIDQDIVEIISTTQYADGKLMQSKMEYKYKDTSDKIINNKKKNAKEIKAIYHAEIYETNDGTIEILYECDKDRCEECDKKNCYIEYCTHTLNKKYAKNYYNKKS